MDFDRFLDELAARARERDDVIGLAAFGSTADRSRADEWSDHDFAWITRPGADDAYRRDRGWLPDHGRIVMHVVERHGGVKVVYDDGHLAEFGVTDLAGLAGWQMNRAVAIVDKGGLADVLDRGAATPRPVVRAAEEAALAACAILVGVGRARRGEVLSGGNSIRGAAVQHILKAVAGPAPERPLDALDPTRRVEVVHPAMAGRIAGALELPLEESARMLLGLAETLAGTDAQVSATVAAVRRRLGWS